MDRKEILNKAESIINGDREGTYGKPEDSFARIAQLWSVYLNKDISSVDVANMMVLLKVARNAGGVYKDDNWIDICGYAALGGEIQSRFDYDSFGQFMNKPVEETKAENHINVICIEFNDLFRAVDAVYHVNWYISNYGYCSVNEYYNICGKTGISYINEKYGWRDNNEIDAENIISLNEFGKWVIKMPAPVKLDKGENK